VFGLLSLFLFALITKQVGQFLHSQVFPLRELVRVDAVFRGNLCNRPLFFQDFEDDFGFLFSRVVFSHGINLHLKPTPFFV